MEGSSGRFDRRTVIRGLSACLLAGSLAGCSGPGGEGEDGGGGEGEGEEGEGGGEGEGEEEGDLRQPVVG